MSRQTPKESDRVYRELASDSPNIISARDYERVHEIVALVCDTRRRPRRSRIAIAKALADYAFIAVENDPVACSELCERLIQIASDLKKRVEVA